MAAPVATDIDVVQGATFSMEVTWEDASSNPAIPIPLTGWRAHMQLRNKRGSSSATIYANLSSAGDDPQLTLEPNGATGVIDVRIPATVTAGLTKNCQYDVFVINNDDPTRAVRLVFGELTLYKSATFEA